MHDENKNRLILAVNTVHTLTDSAWGDLLPLFSEKKILKGDYFVEENSYPDQVGFILDGVLRAFYRTPDGNEYNKTFFVDNSFAVSLAAVIQKSKSCLNFQALTESKLLVANYFEIVALFEKHRCIETLIRLILEIEWVVKKEQREIRLVLNNAEERYIYFQEEYPGLENIIPQYHIASHLGITPIQLSRIRAKMAAK